MGAVKVTMLEEVNNHSLSYKEQRRWFYFPAIVEKLNVFYLNIKFTVDSLNNFSKKIHLNLNFLLFFFVFNLHCPSRVP